MEPQEAVDFKEILAYDGKDTAPWNMMTPASDQQES